MRLLPHVYIYRPQCIHEQTNENKQLLTTAATTI